MTLNRFKILSGDRTIGETDLDMCDPGMNVYSGHLRVTSEYKDVREIFKIFASTLDQTGARREELLSTYYSRRDLLGLRLEARNGERISAQWIHITDLEDDLDNLQIEVSLAEPLVES